MRLAKEIGMNEHETHTMKQPTRLVGVTGAIEREKAAQQIGELWQRAVAAGLLRHGQPAHAAYYDYQDRLANRYRVLVGRETDDEPGTDQEVVFVRPGDYASFAEEGPAIDAAQGLWKQVWTRWAQRDKPRFDVDVERHEGCGSASESFEIGRLGELKGGAPPSKSCIAIQQEAPLVQRDRVEAHRQEASPEGHRPESRFGVSCPRARSASVRRRRSR